MSTGHPRKIHWWFGALCAALVAIAIMLLLPAIKHSREDVKWIDCNKNLKQIGLALQNYAQEYGSLPPAYTRDKAGRPLLSWRVLILPYLERDDLYRQVRLDESWDSPTNLRLARQLPDVYHCPADTAAKEGETSYLAVVGAQTAWPGIEGGEYPSSTRSPGTILVVEASGYGISWMEPRDMPFAEAIDGVTEGGGKAGIICRHPCGGGDEPIRGVYGAYKPSANGYRLCGANCLFTGGYVYSVSETVSPETLLKLLTAETGR